MIAQSSIIISGCLDLGLLKKRYFWNLTLRYGNFSQPKFFNSNNNKFIFLLQKGVYPYEYLDDWEKLNETSLPEKYFYRHLNMEDITDATVRCEITRHYDAD